MNNFIEKILTQLLKEKHLTFELLFTAKPHVFIIKTDPLAKKEKVTLKDLEPSPRLSFDRGEHSSFYFSEEILSTLHSPNNILVSARATIVNCMISLNGYTISSGILSEELNGTDIIPVPLDVDDEIKVGWITNNKTQLTRVAKLYQEELYKTIESYKLL